MSVGNPIRKSPFLLAALAMAVVVLSHCGPQEDRCSTHDDCASGEFCVTRTGACEERRGGGGAGAEGDACSSRTDCIEGLVCAGGSCAYPTADGCETAEDCPRGTRCDEANQCVAGCATSADCASDEACDFSLARCVHCSLTDTCGDETDGGDNGDGGTDGGDKGDGGSDGGPTPDCTTKYDCADGEVCQGGSCRSPTTTACTSSATCGRGRVCTFMGQCEAGCEENRDCADGRLCHPTRLMCEKCSPQNPCGAGELCVEEACVAAPTCGSTADCVGSYDGSICRDGFCTNCSGHASCNTAPYSTSQPPKNFCTNEGFCVGATCSDEQCKESFGEKGYCNHQTGSCGQYECLVDSDCGVAGYACQNNICTQCSGQAYTECEATCASKGQTCDVNSCGCVGGGGGGGGACTSDADCSGGNACMMFGILPCGSFPIPGMACECGGGGGGFPGGGGSSCTTNADCAPGQTCTELFPGMGGTCS